MVTMRIGKREGNISSCWESEENGNDGNRREGRQTMIVLGVRRMVTTKRDEKERWNKQRWNVYDSLQS